MNCADEAPVPITATRSPLRSCSWSHSAEWNIVPSNESSPGTSGRLVSLSGPVADTSTWARKPPSGVVISQR